MMKHVVEILMLLAWLAVAVWQLCKGDVYLVNIAMIWMAITCMLIANNTDDEDEEEDDNERPESNS